MVWVQRWNHDRLYENTDSGYYEKISSVRQPCGNRDRGVKMGLYQNRIVVKVGTSTLTNEWGKSDFRSFDRLACVLSDVQNMGYEVILVSSGAIAVGKNKLNLQAAESMVAMSGCSAARTARIVAAVSAHFAEPHRCSDSICELPLKLPHHIRLPIIYS